jgi:hypothetical protein
MLGNVPAGDVLIPEQIPRNEHHDPGLAVRHGIKRERAIIDVFDDVRLLVAAKGMAGLRMDGSTRRVERC